MPLKAIVKDISTVAEPLRELYTQVGDEYVLDVEDGEYKGRISEFRNNNVTLQKQIKDLTEKAGSVEELQQQLAQFKDLDPEQARAAMEQMNALKDQELLDAGKLDEVLAQRTERMRGDYDTQIGSLKSALDEAKEEANKYKSKLTEVVIDSSLQKAVAGVASVKKGAMQDVIARGKAVWTLGDDGNPTPRDASGNLIYGKDPSMPITMEEWAQGLTQEAGYLFESNAGGGSQGNLQTGDASKTVSINDGEGMSANLEQIAAGKVKVVQ